MQSQIKHRPQTYHFKNGTSANLPFSQTEYNQRIDKLRAIMQKQNLDAVILTSMHNIAYYSGFLYCAFGRPYACVVTNNHATTLSAGIDGGQPARRSSCENRIYTDWQRDNYWRAVRELCNQDHPRKNAAAIGIEEDHLTLALRNSLQNFLNPKRLIDIAAAAMQQRMIKSSAEIALIKQGAKIADIGGYAIRDAIKVGKREIDVAMAGRNAMEYAIAEQFPDSELRDTWVWFQSGLNTDGAHNPLTTRILAATDILSLNTFPMINGYYTALERTLFLGEPSPVHLEIWQANVAAHELGLSLIKPGIKCCDICHQINDFFAERDLLRYRSFGYGHSFGLLSHYYGREAGLELREDIDTVFCKGMVISMEPMLTIPENIAGAGGYREHDILVIGENGAENITQFPYGPNHNIIAV